MRMETLIPEIEAFCATYGLTERQFGVAAVKDKNFVPDLRDGREIRSKTRNKVTNFMASYCTEQAA